jgi:hypothetical protein
MLTSYTDIKNRVIEMIDANELGYYPDRDQDTLYELADGEVPVYYHEIISEWSDLPMSASDRWEEMGLDANATITDRMRVDLLLHYESEYNEAYREVLSDREEA